MTIKDAMQYESVDGRKSQRGRTRDKVEVTSLCEIPIGARGNTNHVSFHYKTV